MEFLDAFYVAYFIPYDIQWMTQTKSSISMYTYSLSLFEIITKVTQTTEKRVMIDLKTFKESYN